MKLVMATTRRQAFLALATALAFAPGMASAQQPPAGALGITGTWNHVLTVRNCATGAVIAQSNPMSSYLQSGVAIEMNPLPGAALRTPSLGIWKYLGNQQYAQVNWVDTAAPALGEMIHRLAQALKVEGAPAADPRAAY